ncbi:mitochondrial ribosome and complex I assembly factor AltMIEF1-like [Glandiceps talaboti]
MSVNTLWSRPAVLSLYKRLLREGERLKFTDVTYYKNYIRNEFKSNMQLTENSEKQKQVEKGYYFLKSKLGGLL